MFASQNFATSQDLYCIWIRADETPGAPLIAVWIDTKMRAFNSVEHGSACVATDGGAAVEAAAFDS
jgi:hypothetical protein